MAAKHDSKYDHGVGKHLLPETNNKIIAKPSIYTHLALLRNLVAPSPLRHQNPLRTSHTIIATIDTIDTISLNPVSAPELPEPSSPCAPEPSGRGRVPPQSAAPQMSSQN
ncbi:hypothetical protein M758_2G117300 [Ceratodon purpureus]|nr:hypothetical protein M758_2G117300 [Ceratodon purpureus]